MYLYQLNYPLYEQELCFLEMKSLFQDTIDKKLFFHAKNVDEGRSIFIKWKLEVLYQDEDYEILKKRIQQDKLYFEDFKVQYVKNETNHLEYRDMLAICKEMAECMDGTCDMHQPKLIFGVSKVENLWVFGIYHQNNESWRKHDDKPYTYSYSMSVRDARTCLNILVGDDLDKTLVDPCCGIGTIVFEAIALNLNVEGYDINRDVVWKAKKNLMHYGYNDVIKHQDMHALQKHYDLAFMDIPYGIYTPITYQQQFALIESCRRIASKALIVTFEDMEEDIKKAGFKIISKASVSKQRFTRYIYVAS